MFSTLFPHMHLKINKISRGFFCKEPFNLVWLDLLNGGYWYLKFSNSLTAVILNNVHHLPSNYLFFVEPTYHFFLVIGAPLPWGSILPAPPLPHCRHDEESIKYSLRQVQLCSACGPLFHREWLFHYCLIL